LASSFPILQLRSGLLAQSRPRVESPAKAGLSAHIVARVEKVEGLLLGLLARLLAALLAALTRLLRLLAGFLLVPALLAALIILSALVRIVHENTS
jgi:hypothetical protein